MASKKKITAPAPRLESDRQIEVPRTVGRRDTTSNDGLNVSKTRADFRPEEFERVILQHGKYLVWRKALLCPCFNPETEQAMVNCPNCNADGYIYVHPMRIRGLMMSFDKRMNIFEKFGVLQAGATNVTVSAKYRLGYRDSLEMEDQLISFNELLTKGNRRGPRSVLPAGVDSARFRIVNVAALILRDKSGAVLSLEEGIHFSITDEGWIRWTSQGNRAIPDKTTFSLHYDFHPIYQIDSWPHATRDDVSGRKTVPSRDRVVALPLQAAAKLDFLVNANGLPSMLQPVAGPSGFGAGGLPDELDELAVK